VEELTLLAQGIQCFQCQLESTGTVSRMGRPTLMTNPHTMTKAKQVHMAAPEQQQHFLGLRILTERPNPRDTSRSVSSRLFSSAW
jgi:hypothetical protein